MSGSVGFAGVENFPTPYRAEIKSRYREWEIVGPAEVRGDKPVEMFQPVPRRTEKPVELQPHLEPVVRKYP